MPRKTRMNSITSPELLTKVNFENKQLLNDFIDYLRSTQKSEGTISNYKNDIEIAWVWCLQNNNNQFFVNWTKRNIIAYQNWMLANGNSPARIRRLKASLSSLSNYIENLLDDEFPNFRNIINKVESPVNQPVRTKTILSEEQVDNLLEELTAHKKYDKACALALALCSGRRKAELVRFRLSDFDEKHLVCEGALYKSDPIKTKGRGINGKQLECFCLAKKFDPYLKNWIDYRNEHGISSEWLFPAKDDPNKHLELSTLNSWAITFGRMLKVDFYWHAMRHATVTKFKRAGIPDTVIQQYIGWSDIAMVPVYVDMDADEQLGMYFNADGIVTPAQKSINEL